MSPHLIDFRERIVVEGKPISEEYLLRFLERWGSDAEDLGATFFEITTAMALQYFAEQEVDVAIIETGLGGRLDSTNVITPLVTGITSIAMDHQEYLGDTEESIAREKAGIMKRGIPAVIGPVSTSARVAIYEVAKESAPAVVIEAPRLYRTGDVRVSASGTTFTVEHGGQRQSLTTGLTGSAQAGNASVALSMLRAAGPPWTVTLDEAAAVLPRVTLPGRFQTVGNCILDVAHNPDGMRSLIATIAELRPAEPIIGVLGVLADKDWRQMMIVLASAVERIVLIAPPSAPPERAWNPQEAEEFARSRGIGARFEPDFDGAVKSAASSEGMVLITGSFHTVGDALIALGQSTL